MDKQTNPGTFSKHATCNAEPNTGLHRITGTYFLDMADLGGSQAGNMAACGMVLDQIKDTASCFWDLLKRFANPSPFCPRFRRGVGL